jgi:hypothetical protein
MVMCVPFSKEQARRCGARDGVHNVLFHKGLRRQRERTARSGNASSVGSVTFLKRRAGVTSQSR